MSSHVLAVDVDRETHLLTARLRGEVDISSVAQLESALTAATQDFGSGLTVLIDMRELTFLDSSGLHALITFRRDSERRHQRLVLVRGPRNVQRIFELTSTDAMFEMVDDPAAINRVGRALAS